MMKNISTKQAPKGRIPPSRQVITGFRYQGCSGICLGMLLVTTGNSRGSFL